MVNRLGREFILDMLKLRRQVKMLGRNVEYAIVYIQVFSSRGDI